MEVTERTQTHSRERDGRWLMIGGGVLLGTIGVFVEEAGQHPLVTVWFRCLFGGLALLLWGVASGRTGELRLHGRLLLLAMVSGVLMILNWAMFFAAISRTSIAVATVVFHIQPFWVLLFGVVFLREAFSVRQSAATAAAMLGLILASGLWGSEGSVAQIDSDYVLGLGLCIGGSLSYAAVTIIAKTAGQISSLALAWWQCMVGTVVLAWVPFVFGWPDQGPAWLWLVGLGVLHTGLAYVVLFSGMAQLRLGQVALLQFVYPLSAVGVDWAIYGHTLSAAQSIGVGIMALALWTIRRPVAK